MLKRINMLLVFALILTMFTAPQTGVQAMKPSYDSVAVGDHHFLAIDSSGTVWAWGRNSFGQLGYAHSGAPHPNTATPVQVRTDNGAMLNNIVSVAAGSGHSVALDRDGRVWTWGFNQTGELGQNIGTNTTNPTVVPIEATIVAIDAGPHHTLALDSNGRVWAWGDNAFGQTAGNTIPGTVPNLNNIIEIAAGGDHSVALRNDGTVWAWGRGTYGQLGTGQTTHINQTPQQVSSLNDVISITAGGYHTLVVREDTRVWGFGLNEYGQLGDLSHYQFAEPTQIPNLSDVTSVKAGRHHSTALKKDGSSWVWGRNPHQPMAHRATPVQIENMNQGVAIATGGTTDLDEGPHTLAVKEDGTLWSWDMRTVSPNSLRPSYSQVLGLDRVALSAAYPFIQGNQVVFRYEGAASQVEVSGQFNQEFIPIAMTEVSTNIWEVQLTIPSGDFYYGFLVDGNWTLDSFNSERERLPSGTFNKLKIPDYVPDSPIINGNQVTFTYSSFDSRHELERDTQTKRVAVQGNFTNWQQVAMTKHSNNTWSVTYEVPPGTYYYNYVIEDRHSSFQEEILDPLNSSTNTNPITGKTYNVLEVSDETMIQVPTEGVGILHNSPMNFVVGEENRLRYEVSPTTATNQKVRWHTSNPNVATVDEVGTVNAIGVGTAIITVATVDGGFTDSITVDVTGQQGFVQFPQPGYKNFGTRTDVDDEHAWKIEFSSPVRGETVHSKNFYVLNAAGIEVDVFPRVDRHNDHIVVLEPARNFSYQPGATYYLFIEGGVHDRNGNSLSEPAMMRFVIGW